MDCCIVFIPETVAHIFKVKIFARLEDNIVQKNREYELLTEFMTGKNFFKSTRIYQAYDFLREKLQRNIQVLGKLRVTAEKKNSMLEMLFRAISVSGQVCAFGLLMKSVLLGRVSIGAFAAVFEAIILIVAYVEEIIGIHCRNISKKAVLVKNFNLLIQLQVEHSEPLPASQDEIILSKVSYR